MIRIPRNHPLVRVGRLPLLVRAVWSYATAIAAVALATVEYLDLKIPAAKWRWLHSERFQFWFAGIILAVIVVDAVRRGWIRQHRSDESALILQLHRTLGAQLVTIAEIVGAPVSDLGAGIYLKQQRFLNDVRLPRAVRFRLLDHPQESGIGFAPGKGAVGQCWESGNPVHHPWHEFNEAFGPSGPTESEWNDLDHDSRYGFDRAEFARMCGRYSEVLAVPIMSKGEAIGVLAIDLVNDHCEEPGYHFWDEGVLASVNLAASAVAKDL